MRNAERYYLLLNKFDFVFQSFTSALAVYNWKNWTIIEDQLNYFIGSNCFKQNPEESLNYYSKLMRYSRSSAAQQSSYLEALKTCYQVIKKFFILELQFQLNTRFKSPTNIRFQIESFFC
jgi:hypothetical protein